MRVRYWFHPSGGRELHDLSQIEVRIYDDELIIWSPGGLPEGVTIEDLYKDHHSSVLRNTGISEVFYDGGLIERWAGNG